MHGRTGVASPTWKGGVTPERQAEYSRPQVRLFLRSIRERDIVCVHCQDSGRLHVHHIKSFAEYPELRYDASNCVSLCVVCHRWAHSRANVNREYLG